MNNQLREIILEIVLEEYESGHQIASDKESFDKVIAEDYGMEVGPEAFEFYAECRNMGPSGFYLMYKDELDFSPEFKAEYGFDDEEQIEESLNEDIDPSFDDKYEVQEVNDKGERLDQFVSFNTEEEAMNFIKKLNTPAQVVQKGVMEESLSPNGKVIYTNIDSLEEGLSRDAMISELRNKGKNYNFDKYSDAQIYRMYEREMNKKVEEPSISKEEDEFIEIKKCPQCNHQLTDAGECPVCDLGDEEERTSHLLYLDESLFNESITYPNGVEVPKDSVDLDKALDFMYGLDRLDNNEYTEEEQQRAINYWIKKTDPSPYEGLNGLNEEVLTEAPFFKKKSVSDTIDAANAKENKQLAKSREKLGSILTYSLKDKRNTFYVNGEWITYDQFIKAFNPASISGLIRMGNDLATTELTDTQKTQLLGIINTVVKDINGNIIRRGLEVFKPGQVIYRSDRGDLLEIKDGHRAEDILPNLKADPKPEAEEIKDANTNNTEEASSETTNDNSTEANSEEAPNNEPAEELPNWVTNDSIKAAITLLAKRKNGSAQYFDAEGNLVDYRKITTDNASEIYVDKNAEKPFLKALEEVKAGLAKRKAAAIKSAALFGESYDDSMEYDYEELEEDFDDDTLTEGIGLATWNMIKEIAKEIGIETIGEATRFVLENKEPGESILDVFKRYRDDLGDDFELHEEVLYSMIEAEDVNDDMGEDSLTWK